MLTRRKVIVAGAAGAGGLLLTRSGAVADERAFGIACRSVHLAYETPRKVAAVYAESIPEQSAVGTYFCVVGFHGGYFGYQELDKNRKVVIFSVWDPGSQDDPKIVAEEKRVAVLHAGEGVAISRFGGEGTGGKSMTPFDWQFGKTYRFLASAKRLGERTAFSGWFGVSAEDGTTAWRHLVTFSTITRIDSMRGTYSFVEDFRRNRESTKFARSARFGNVWAHTGETWQPVTRARFTADANPAMNINAGARDGWMFLATGGETENTDVELGKRVEVAEPASDLDPAGLPTWETAVEAGS